MIQQLNTTYICNISILSTSSSELCRSSIDHIMRLQVFFSHSHNETLKICIWVGLLTLRCDIALIVVCTFVLTHANLAQGKKSSSHFPIFRKLRHRHTIKPYRYVFVALNFIFNTHGAEKKKLIRNGIHLSPFWSIFSDSLSFWLLYTPDSQFVITKHQIKWWSCVKHDHQKTLNKTIKAFNDKKEAIKTLSSNTTADSHCHSCIGFRTREIKNETKSFSGKMAKSNDGHRKQFRIYEPNQAEPN